MIDFASVIISDCVQDISQEVRLTVEEIPGLDFQFTPGEGCARYTTCTCSYIVHGVYTYMYMHMYMCNACIDTYLIYRQY